MARNRSFCDLGALTPHRRLLDEWFRDALNEFYIETAGAPPKPLSYYTSCPYSVSNMGMVNGLIRPDLTSKEAPQLVGIEVKWSFNEEPV